MAIELFPSPALFEMVVSQSAITQALGKPCNQSDSSTIVPLLNPDIFVQGGAVRGLAAIVVSYRYMGIAGRHFENAEETVHCSVHPAPSPLRGIGIALTFVYDFHVNTLVEPNDIRPELMILVALRDAFLFEFALNPL
jgi:hypothetical protein